MNDPKDILLHKWLRGETTAREERQLFAGAQEDPFLAEALEGFALSEGDDLQRLERLKRRLRERSKRRHRPILVWWPRAAAAAAVLLLAVAGFWWVSRQGPTLEIAQDQAPVPEAGSRESMVAEPLGEEAPEAPAGPEPSAKKRAADPPAGDPEKGPRRSRPASDAIPPVPAPDEPSVPAGKNQVATGAARARKEAAEPGLPAPAESLDAMEREEAKPQVLADSPQSPLREDETKIRLAGLVISETGDPLPGAYVTYPQAEKGTVTDEAGRFQLLVPDSLPRELEIAYTGYLRKTVPLRDTDFVTIQLEESLVLSETSIEITSKSSRQQQRPDLPAPEPEGGFRKWNIYLRKNKQYPPTARASGVKGVVRLSFLPDEKGSPADIVVEQSLGYGCDEEALRLLQAGPKWTPASGRRAAVEIAFP